MTDKDSDLANKSPAQALGIPVGLVADVGRSGDEVLDEILNEIMQAGSVDAALKAGTVVGLQDYAGVPLTFHDFAYRPSSYDSGGWPFVVIKATDNNGERLTLTTGARQVIALLALARKNDELPFKARPKVTLFETDDGETRKVVSLETA